ncbi:hypothetical protein [Actinomadura rugatobispora]|uniref:Uncharacterized protein n=1 Tax=Actinomadura rugatobispora TaxID=1994 RepID=A0ABW1ACA3_9ACTN
MPDVVGRFRLGRLKGRRPVALDGWRVTTGDQRVADNVAALLGGTPEEWVTEGEDDIEVLTDADAVEVILDGPDAIAADLMLWGMDGTILHHCDSQAFLSGDRPGQPCGCPELVADRKAAAKSGRGPKPRTRITFRLLGAPGLGKFCMTSGSWDLVRVLHEYADALEGVGGPAACVLKLETVSFTPERGPYKGRVISYKRPALAVCGAYEHGASG